MSFNHPVKGSQLREQPCGWEIPPCSHEKFIIAVSNLYKYSIKFLTHTFKNLQTSLNALEINKTSYFKKKQTLLIVEATAWREKEVPPHEAW
jgi:hypothetical protein